MLSCIKESFSLTNKFIILATPLILFSLFSSLYVLFSLHGSSVYPVITAALFFLMLSAFLAGWFFMIREGIKSPHTEEPNSLIKEFPAGVGEYLLPVMGLLFVMAIVSLVLFTGGYYIGMAQIGDIGISKAALSDAMVSAEAFNSFLSSISELQLLKMMWWYLLFLGLMVINGFLVMFYLPALFFKKSNPFIAYYISLKDLFSRKFFSNCLLYIIIFISYSILSVLTSLFGANIFLHFLFTLINFYYLIYIAVLVCNWYYTNFARTGGNIDQIV